MTKLSVPEGARQVVKVEDIAEKQEMIPYKTKGGEDRERTRFMVRIHDDGKEATMTDSQNPDYIKYQEKRIELGKTKVKLDKAVYQARLAKQREIGTKIGIREGRKVFREEVLPKRIEAAYKKGLKDGKPQVNKLERANKLEEKAREMIARAEQLKSDVKPSKEEKKASKKKEKAPEAEEASATEEVAEDVLQTEE